MKKFLNVVGVSLMMVIATMFSHKAEAQMRVGLNISFQTFYDELSPYGDWVDYPEYGYTWRPRVGNDFRPYATNGRWVYADDYDWMWASDYNWGWAPFHYGRWFYDDYYGWMWVPGYDWSPAWVSWRGGGDYYGWAPLQPGFNISLGFGSYNPPSMYWNFAHGRYMTYNNIGRYCSPWHNNVTIINNTTIINNYSRRNNYYVGGPDRRGVERYTGRIRSVNVREVNNPSRGSALKRNEYSVYRPTVDRSARSNDNRVAAPRSVRTYDAAARGGSVDRNNTRINDDNRTSGRLSRNNSNRVDNGTVSRQRNSSIENRTESRSNRTENQTIGNGNRSNTERPNTEMRQRREQPQVMEQPRTESRSRNFENNQNRVERTTPQRSMESRPARVEAPQQRMESRPQRSMESRPARVEAPQQRMESRSNRVEMPQRSMESRSMGVERSAGRSESRSGGERRGRN